MAYTECFANSRDDQTCITLRLCEGMSPTVCVLPCFLFVYFLLFVIYVTPCLLSLLVLCVYLSFMSPPAWFLPWFFNSFVFFIYSLCHHLFAFSPGFIFLFINYVTPVSFLHWFYFQFFFRQHPQIMNLCIPTYTHPRTPTHTLSLSLSLSAQSHTHTISLSVSRSDTHTHTHTRWGRVFWR